MELDGIGFLRFIPDTVYPTCTISSPAYLPLKEIYMLYRIQNGWRMEPEKYTTYIFYMRITQFCM